MHGPIPVPPEPGMGVFGVVADCTVRVGDGEAVCVGSGVNDGSGVEDGGIVKEGMGDWTVSGVGVPVASGNGRLVGVTRNALSVNWALKVAATLVLIDSVGIARVRA